MSLCEAGGEQVCAPQDPPHVHSHGYDEPHAAVRHACLRIAEALHGPRRGTHATGFTNGSSLSLANVGEHFQGRVDSGRLTALGKCIYTHGPARSAARALTRLPTTTAVGASSAGWHRTSLPGAAAAHLQEGGCASHQGTLSAAHPLPATCPRGCHTSEPFAGASRLSIPVDRQASQFVSSGES